MYWRASLSRAASASRYSSRLPALLRRCAWAIFAVCGIVYASMNLWGNVEYALGRDSSDLERAAWHLKRAGEIFPLNHGFRLGLAYYFMFLGFDGKDVMAKALENDPNALDIQRYAKWHQ